MASYNGNAASSRWSLKGSTALVTGGTRGIGRAVVEELVGFGASVYICGRHKDRLQERLQAWRESGFNVAGLTCDLRFKDQRDQLMREVSDYFGGKLNILINNAGTGGPVKSTVEMTEEDCASVMSLNFEAGYHLCQLAYPLLKASGDGRIVFTSSVAGFVPLANLNNMYGISKAAVNHLVKSLAAEWAKDGIRVNAVAPGLIETELAAPVINRGSSVLRDVPAGRTGQPQEVAAVMGFLCLPCSAYCTGEIVRVDGGTMVRPLFS